MRRRNILVSLSSALCIALAAGCTTISQGQPQPGTIAPSPSGTSSASFSTSASPSGGQLPSDGAPKVKNPLDATRYQRNPCEMLSAAQLQELNLGTQGEPGEAPLGLACAWRNRDTGGN